MHPQGPLYLSIVAVGFVVAFGFDFLGRTSFAQEHKKLKTIIELAVVVALCAGSVKLTDSLGGIYLPLFGYFVTSKIDESRRKRQRIREARAALEKCIDDALAARQGEEAVEFDLAAFSDDLRQVAIARANKEGLTVETVKNEITGQIRLRLSGKSTLS